LDDSLRNHCNLLKSAVQIPVKPCQDVLRIIRFRVPAPAGWSRVRNRWLYRFMKFRRWKPGKSSAESV